MVKQQIHGTTTARLLRCLLLLTLVLCQHCRAETVSVTGSFNTSELTYSGYTYDLTTLSGKTDTAIVNIFSPIIKDGGVYFKGFSSYTLSRAAPALKLNVTDATVTNAPIKITGWFPPHSYTTISGTKATMLGSTILFDFRTLVPKDNVMFFVVNTVAEWTTLPGGVVLALVDEDVRVLIEVKSGFYLLRINVTGAMNMVKLYGQPCSGLYCLDVYNGLFTVDYANCTNCNGAFFDAGLQMCANSRNGMIRFQNCTHLTGKNQPFFYSNSANMVFSLGNNANLIYSAITTDGDLFSVPNGHSSKCPRTAQVVFQHINAKGHGLGSYFFGTLQRDCDIYVGNLTFDGVNYTEPSQFESMEIGYTKIVNVFGKTVHNARTAFDTTIKDENSYVYCLRTSFTGLKSELVPSDEQNQKLVADGFSPIVQWSRSRCICKEGSFTPYCTEVFDPLLYPVGYTYEVPKCTTDPVSCKQCRWGEWSTCGECNPGYKFNNAGECIPKGCSVDNCQTCVFDDEHTCDTCDIEYKLSGSSCARKTCAQAPCLGCEDVSGNSDVCTSCKEPNVLNSLTQQCDACVAKYKYNGTDCVEKTCTKSPCLACDSDSGNSDICTSCKEPNVVNPSTQQCNACEAGYKWNAGTSQCDEKQCNVPNCQTCVFDDEDKCQTCDDKYKLSGTDCVQKTCAKSPCTQCTSESGNTDTCQTCIAPFVVNPSTQQCNACEAGYKWNAGTSQCDEKQCNVANCQDCVFDEEDKCQTCTTPFAVNPSTQQCNACEAGYKWNAGTSQCDEKQCNVPNCETCIFDEEDKCQTCDDKYKVSDNTCVQKTCTKAPCTQCTSDSGNTDICTSCDLPHILNNATQQCDACEPGLKYIQGNGTCVKKQCLVENCAECVFDQEYVCKSCGGDSQLNDNSQCSAVSDDRKLSPGVIAGIIVAIVAVLLIAFLLIFFLCCRNEKQSYEEVDHMEMKNIASVEGNNLPSVKVEEETEVMLMNPEGEGDERNPLAPLEADSAPPTEGGGRRARRGRSVRRAQTEIADVDLNAMYSKDNEIEEEGF